MDQGQRQTEALVKKLEKQLNKEYLQAIDEMEDELLNYFQRFEKKDSTWRRWVDNGLKTTKEYQEWRFGQMAVGKRWMEQMNSIAKEMNKVNETAKSLIRKYTPEMYANNYNYATYQVEKDARIDTSFNLVNKEAIEHIVREDPDVLPAPGKQVRKAIAEGKAERWNKKTLQSVMTQGILQGDSIPKLATRLATAVGDKNRKAAIRNARTMATGAMNAGREDAFKRAQRKGVDLEQMWLATMDNRTRHTHRWIDREVRPVGEAFSNGCEYPGDPKGDPAEIYNCRCSMRGVVKGLERRSGKFRDDSAIKGMSYDEWKRDRSRSNPIDLSEKKGKSIAAAERAKYSRGENIFGSNGTNGSVGEHQPPQFLERIDYSDKSLVKSKLEEYESLIVNEPIENAIVICSNGEIYRCYGDLNGVDPYADLGDKIIHSSMTHNHPEKSNNEYSFSRADQSAYETYKQEILRGIDSKYVYEFHRDPHDIDELMSFIEVMQDGEHNFRHSQVISESLERGYGYRRKKRG